MMFLGLSWVVAWYFSQNISRRSCLLQAVGAVGRGLEKRHCLVTVFCGLSGLYCISQPHYPLFIKALVLLVASLVGIGIAVGVGV